MVGKKTELTYQLPSRTKTSTNSYSTVWYGVRKIKGNLMMDMGVNAFREPFINDKKEVITNYVFVPRHTKSISFSSDGRFIHEKTGRIFNIKVHDNPGELNFSNEIYLTRII